MSFTERQQRMIDKCKATGFGWRKFAESVEASGNCTKKQEDTLRSMILRIRLAEYRKQRYRSSRRLGTTEWDDHNLDAQSSGYESNAN